MRNTERSCVRSGCWPRPPGGGASVGVSMGAVSLALERAAEAKLTWEGVEALDDAELEARLYPRA